MSPLRRKRSVQSRRSRRGSRASRAAARIARWLRHRASVARGVKIGRKRSAVRAEPAARRSWRGRISGTCSRRRCGLASPSEARDVVTTVASEESTRGIVVERFGDDVLLRLQRRRWWKLGRFARWLQRQIEGGRLGEHQRVQYVGRVAGWRIRRKVNDEWAEYSMQRIAANQRDEFCLQSSLRLYAITGYSIPCCL